MIKVIITKITRPDLSKLHFCRDNKVKYRLHLTWGMILSTIVGCIGTHYHMDALIDVSLAFNLLTALMWIWE